MPRTLKQNWFSNTHDGLPVDLVIAPALTPEAIAFSIIAGVDPKIGLHASFSMAVVIALASDHLGMISVATDAMTLLIVSLVKDHGLQYLLAVTLLCDVLQIPAGYLRLGSLMRFVSHLVVTGFVDALAILIFTAQLPEPTDVGWPVYAMTATDLVIVYGFPHLSRTDRLLPSPLVCILVLIGVSVYLGLDIRTVGGMGQLPDSLPLFLRPGMPLNLDTLLTVLPYPAALAVVGLLEPLMAVTIADEMTDTDSDKNCECKGQGLVDIATDLPGGMAGCVMIGQLVINVKSGGCNRLSILMTDVALLLMMVFFSDWVERIPMTALVAVMIMVSINTFRREPIRNPKRYPLSTNLVMLTTIDMALAAYNLVFGVVVGVLLASPFFANKIGHYLDIDSERSADGIRRHYQVSGQVFFVSSGRSVVAFDLKETLKHVLTGLCHAYLWDIAAVVALDKVVLGFHQYGVQAGVLGLNTVSTTPIDHFGAYDEPGAVGTLSDH